MQKMAKISVSGLLMIACSCAHAQQAITLDDNFVLPSILFDRSTTSLEDTFARLAPISPHQLSELRSAGVDPSWISDGLQIPSFDPKFYRRATQGDHPLAIESWATHHSDGRGMQINDSLRFSVGRTTELRDGNISGSGGSLDSGPGDEHISSLTQSEGEYDVYDLSLQWDAINAGAVTVSVLSGLKAIEANIGKRVTKDGETSIETVHRVAAVPMVGSSVRWQVNESLSFSGAALTHPIDTGDSLIDFNASTDLRLSTNVRFSAGYRILRSSFEVGSVDTDINQEGLFARLQISF